MTRPGAIALVCPYSLDVPGGVQGQVVMMALELARRGRRVLVVSPGAASNELLAADIAHESLGGSRRIQANGSEAPISLNLRTAASLRRTLAASDSVVTHLHEPLAPLANWFVLATRPTGLVGTFHRSGVDRMYRLVGGSLRPLVRRIDVMAAVSEAAAATAAEVIGVEMKVLFNGIDVGAYATAPPWPAPGPTIMFLGRDEPRKGRSVLLEAAQLLTATTSLWVTGEPPAGWRQPDGATVTFIGTVGDDEKRRRLRAADVLVAPALGGESFGMILLEGLAAGAAVVASDIDGYRQALAGAGTLVPPADPHALAAALHEQLQLPRPVAPQPRALDFSIESLVDAYEDLYDEAAEAARARK